MTRATPHTVLQNIQTVIAMEEAHASERTFSDRISDLIGSFAGTATFVLLHLAWFGAWFAINAGALKLRPFDPYPFPLLAMIVSLEGVLLSTFVLIKQNRMAVRADHRNHLNLQINLLTEREVTVVMKMLEQISAHLGIQQPVMQAEVEELGVTKAVDDLSDELKKSLPEQP